MSEKKFLNCIMIEGALLTLLGLSVLILPKLTSISFGVMLSIAFMVYGIYKTISGITGRIYNNNFIFCIVLGIFAFTIGLLLLFVPKISLLWLIALIGIYFLLESISATAFAARIRSLYSFWGCKLVTAGILFLIGLVIVLGIPVISFFAVAMLCGIALLTKGISKLALYSINKNNYSM